MEILETDERSNKTRGVGLMGDEDEDEDVIKPHWPEPVFGPCTNCKERPAKVWWAPGGVLEANRGFAWPWCNLCALRTQLAHAEEQAEKITELRGAIIAEETKEK